MDKSYEEALDYLYGFVDYSVKRSYRYSSEVFDLERVSTLLARMGNPHESFKAVHIAGTKGKGSTAALIESGLRAAGYRTGLYTSPHLLDFTERIRVCDQEIGKQEVADLVEEIKPFVEEIPGLTTYELVTAVGFLHFARSEIDIAVVEVGLGGRLDATNVITPVVSVITSISYDHMHLLGASLSDIAREKAGIIKPGVPVIVSPQQYEVEGVLAAIAESRGSPYFRVGRDWHFSAGNHDLHGQSLYIWSREEQPLMDSYIEAAGEEEWVPPRYRIQLLGYHQVVNAATAYAALSVLRVHGVRVREVEIREGFWKAQWPGRFQILSMDPALVVDSAHNRDSALKLRIALDDYYPGQQVTLIFGASADKDISGMLSELVPRMSRIIVTQASHPRAAEPEVLAEHARSYSMHVREAVPVKAALECALEQARPDEVVLAAGSIFVVGDILSAWQEILGRVGAPDGQEET